MLGSRTSSSAVSVRISTPPSAGAAARHPDVESITIVDLERSVALATRRFEDLNHGVLDDPRVELVIDDGRNHLRTTDRRYDVMVVDSTQDRTPDRWA